MRRSIGQMRKYAKSRLMPGRQVPGVLGHNVLALFIIFGLLMSAVWEGFTALAAVALRTRTRGSGREESRGTGVHPQSCRQESS
jgi:hypothetical protein